jgi:hypothetical protein
MIDQVPCKKYDVSILPVQQLNIFLQSLLPDNIAEMYVAGYSNGQCSGLTFTPGNFKVQLPDIRISEAVVPNKRKQGKYNLY